MPLKTHRILFQTYENSFKREDAQKWLVDFIAKTELLKPINYEKSGILIDKLVQLSIIEQVNPAVKLISSEMYSLLIVICYKVHCTKNWLRNPTILYKFSSADETRVEKLRSLRYYRFV